MKSLLVTKLFLTIIKNLFIFTTLFALSFQQQTTQLCGDPSCTGYYFNNLNNFFLEKLFATHCVRNYKSNHKDILNCIDGKIINIHGVKLSPRPDLLYGEVGFL